MHGPVSRGQVVAAVGVLLVLVAPLTAVSVPPSALGAAQTAEQVDSCRTIDEPGEYELAGDVTSSATDACIHVAASDVVLDGNGHTVAGQNASGTGVLVFRGEDVSPGPENALENVTVRNLTAANWSTGVSVGKLDGGGTDVRLANVTARDSEAVGVRLVETENVTARDVTATGNGLGVLLWEVQYADLRDVAATGNGDYGVMLTEVSGENTFRNVTATGNGGDAENGAGVYFSTDTGDNVVADARIADNRGAGVRFSDSFGNTLRDTVVAGNDGAGVYGVPAYEDALRNVTVRGNGGPVVAHDFGPSRFVADGLHVGDVATLSFAADRVSVQRTDATALPEPPQPLASERAVSLSDVETNVTTALSVGDADNSSLWRYDGTEWQRVDGATADADAGTVSGTVSGNGTVVALAATASPEAPEDQNGQSGQDRQSDQDGQSSQNEQSQDEPDQQDSDTDQAQQVGEGNPADGTLVVQATTDGDFGYLFVVDGDAEGVETENVAADSGDTVVENGDGTVTVVGSTGSNAGDAFEVDGEVVEFYTPAPASEYVLELDGEDVTDEIPEPNEDE